MPGSKLQKQHDKMSSADNKKKRPKKEVASQTAAQMR